MTDSTYPSFHSMPLHRFGPVPGSLDAANETLRERNRARALDLARACVWGADDAVLREMVDHLLHGAIPRNHAESLVAADINRERLTNGF